MPTSSRADALSDAFQTFMRYFMAHINPVLHRTAYSGRTFSEHEIIVTMALSVVGPQRPGELSRGLAIDKGTLTSVIKRLHEAGLVERRPVAGDARGYVAALSEAGTGLVGHLAEQRVRGFRELFGAMDPDEIDAAAHGLRLIATHLQALEAEHAAQPIP
jgi:DNA-binding MarR family transcriptional regulator